MGKIITLITLIGLMSTGPAFAKRLDIGGSITLRDGGQIVRINVGSEENQGNRAMVRRVKRLERAVRALQNRVYDLEDGTVPRQMEVVIHTCVLPTSFDGTFIGKGKTRAEARASATNACRAGGAPFCSDRRIKSCEKNVEYINN